jgi:cbb3-type cytochrome oxidase subunit 3
MYQEFYAGSDLLVFPLIGLGIFFVAFVAVIVYVLFFMRRGRELDRIASLPLDDDDLPNSRMETVDHG